MRSKHPNQGNLFELQALEPRVLLSADLLASAAATAPKASHGQATEEVAVGREEAANLAQKCYVVAYDAGAQIADIFDGMTGEVAQVASTDSSSEMAQSAVPASIPVESAAAVPDFSTAAKPELPPATETAPETDAASNPEQISSAESAATKFQTTPVSAQEDGLVAPGLLSVDPNCPIVEQLTTTLKAANGPPSDGLGSSVEQPSQPTSADREVSAEGIVAFNDRPLSVDQAADATQSAAGSGAGCHLVVETPWRALGTLEVGVGDRLSGSGTVIGDVVNRGVVSPGNSPGIQTVTGSFTFTRSGSTHIEIGGLTPGPGATVDDGYDQIDVNGAVQFGGTLQVTLINGFIPQVGQRFDIVKFGSATGSFDNYEGLVIGNGLYLRPTYDAIGHKLTLTVVAHSATAVNRPVIFIPGFAGSFFADDTAAGIQEWLLTRGIAPDKLVLEPLTNAYSNLVQSLVNVGYTPGVDLFVANWDWRLPVATQDTTANGRLDNVTASGITDATFETGVDYLGYYLSKAVNTWSALTGLVLPAVDFVTHSTGGLIARAYIESAAYGAGYGAGLMLPKVFNFVESAAPNQGAAGPVPLLNNDFSQKTSSRVLGRAVNEAYKLLRGGLEIQNPGTAPTTKAQLDAEGGDGQRWFISRYVQSFSDLLATYAFIDLNNDGTFEQLTIANGGFENTLLKDLNGGLDRNAFLDLVLGVTTVIYSGEVQTENRVIGETGFNALRGRGNEILPFNHYVGDLPGATTPWFATIESDANGPEGDGTVPTESSIGQFSDDAARLSNGKLILASITHIDAGVAVDHTGLTNNLFAQQRTIEALTGVRPAASAISTTLELSRALAGLKLIQYGLISPTEFGQEIYGRVSPLVAVLGPGTRPDLETVINFIFNTVDGLAGGAPLTATLTTPVGTGSFGISPAAGSENGFAFLALNGISFLAGSAGTGVKLDSGKLGLVLFTDGTYALSLSGTASIVGVPGLNFSGTVALLSNNSGAVNQTLTVGAETVRVNFAQDAQFGFGGKLTLITPIADLDGDFAVEVNGSDVLIGAADVTTFVGDKKAAGAADDVGIRVNNAQFALAIFADQNYAFSASGTAAMSNVPGVVISGKLTIEKNTSAAAVQRTVSAGLATVALNLTAGASQISGAGLVFTVAGFDVGGDFSFIQGTAPALAVAVSNVHVEIGSPVIAKVIGLAGNFSITETGLNGAVVGTVILDVPGASFAGNFDVVIAGSNLTVIGNPSTLTVFGQTITGSFELQRTTTGGGEQVVKISATGVGAVLGAPAVVTMVGGSGALIARSSGISGRVTGGVSINAGPVSVPAPGPGVTPANFDLIFNNTALAVNETFAIGGALAVPAGPYLRFAAGGDLRVTVGGAPQALRGEFAFERSTRSADGVSVVRLAATGASMKFTTAAGTELVSLTEAEGFFIFENGGFAGRVSGIAGVTLPGVTLSAAASTEISTFTLPVSESIQVGGATLTLDLPAGPYLRLTVKGGSILVAGQKLVGDFTFTKNAAAVTVAVSGLSLSFGGAETFMTARASSATLTLSAAGVTATVSGATLDAALPGVVFGGTFELALDTTAATPFVRVNGSASLSVENATLNGTFAIEQFTTLGGSKTVKVGLTGLTLTLGDGPTPFVNVTNGAGTLLVDRSGLAANFLVTAAVHIPGGVVNSTATARIQINTRASAVDESIVMMHDLVLPGGPFARVELTGVTLTIAGSTLPGRFRV